MRWHPLPLRALLAWLIPTSICLQMYPESLPSIAPRWCFFPLTLPQYPPEVTNDPKGRMRSPVGFYLPNWPLQRLSHVRYIILSSSGHFNLEGLWRTFKEFEEEKDAWRAEDNPYKKLPFSTYLLHLAQCWAFYLLCLILIHYPYSTKAGNWDFKPNP